MKATIPLQARKGRASYLGERSIGHQDPGATSTFLILRALLQAVQTEPADLLSSQVVDSDLPPLRTTPQARILWSHVCGGRGRPVPDSGQPWDWVTVVAPFAALRRPPGVSGSV